MLRGKFENCYGLENFELETIDFSRDNKAIIYAPNGVMKTSFSNVFYDISKGKKTIDRIFEDVDSKYDIHYFSNNYTDNQLEENKLIYVIKSFEQNFELSKETISTLLSDEETKKKYENITRQFIDELKEFKKKLSELSGFSIGSIEEKLKHDFNIDEKMDWNDIFETINSIFSNESVTKELEGIKYVDLINDKTEIVFSTTEFIETIDRYVELVNELISNNEVLSNRFTDYNAEELGKSLQKHNLFENKHKIVLQNGKEITSLSQWNDIVNQELNKIYSNPEINKTLKTLSKKLAGNEQVRKLREIILDKKELLIYLKDINKLKQLMWINYFYNLERPFNEYYSKINSFTKQIKEIYEIAEKQAEKWNNVVKEFNLRFKVPFEVKISNKANFLLKDEAPNLYFTYTKGKGTASEKSVNMMKDELMDSLSMGERRAMYLLYVLFDVETIKEDAAKNSDRHLIIVDDIADSFDYKNKYAIIEYLLDISKIQNIDLLILTHNFDFYRSVVGRIRIPREHCYLVQKCENEQLKMCQFGYLKDYFSKGIVNAIKDGNMDTDEKKIKMIVSVPFYRNLAEYMLLDSDILALTCLLHIKESPIDTEKQMLSDIWNIIPSCFKVGFGDFLSSNDELYIDSIRRLASKICLNLTEKIILENKILLSIAIRLELEIYLKQLLESNGISIECDADQTRKWSEKAKQYLTKEQQQIIEEVNLLTPEAIHINSFMYEPIIDMSDWMLKELYKKVLGLNGLTI